VKLQHELIRFPLAIGERNLARFRDHDDPGARRVFAQLPRAKGGVPRPNDGRLGVR
jgi:hypothetical protein